MVYHTHNIIIIGPGGLRAPCVLACAMRSLAIVITIVQSFFFSLFLFFFSPSFAFDPLRGISRLFTASVRSRPPGPPAVPEVFVIFMWKDI